MKELTCIVCPNGCYLKIDENTKEVSGNKCLRGKDFAINELTCPKRTITSTIRTIYKEVPVLPVKVDKEIPKDKIFDVMKEINKVKLDYIANLGDIIIKNVCDLDVNVVVTSSLLKETFENGKNS